MIKVSIVTVTYNAGARLTRTADSVLAQKYPCVEHIIIDGASTDDTIERARHYQLVSSEAGNGHEVTITSEPDDGIYDAMNKGLAKVTGDYIVFLNAGDTLPDPSTIRQVVGVARIPHRRFVDPDTAPKYAKIAELPAVDKEEPLPGIIYGDTDIVDENGTFLRHRRLTPPKSGLTWRSFKAGMLVCHQAFYARADIAKACTYDTSYSFSADVDWCIRVMKTAEQQGLTLRNAHAVLANYLAQGLTTENHRASLVERFRVMRAHYGLVTTIMRHISFIFRTL